MRHPSSGSMTERPTDTPEILIPMHMNLYTSVSALLKQLILYIQYEKDVSSQIHSFLWLFARTFCIPKSGEELYMDKANMK